MSVGTSNKIFGLDKRSLAFFRLFISLVLIYDLVFYRVCNFDYLYSDQGLMGRNFVSYFKNDLLFIDIGGSTAIGFIFLISFILYVFFFLGIFKKVVPLLVYAMFLYFTSRFSLLVFGPDQYIIVLLTFSLFLPLYSHYSYSDSRQEHNSYEIRNLPVWGILIQISCVYFFNAINKNGNTWLDGSAVRIAILDCSFSTPLSYWLSENIILCKVLTYLTLAFEFSLPFLLFCPYRNQRLRIFLSLAIAIFHLLTALFMNLGLFPYVGICVAILILPSIFWEQTYIGRRLDVILKNVFKRSLFEAPSPYNLNKMQLGIVCVLIFICIQKNIFNFLNLTYLYYNKTYRSLYKPFAIIDNLNVKNGAFFTQSWCMFSPNPSNELGILTIEGVTKDNKLINLSMVNPFDPENNFKTYPANNLTRLLCAEIRHFLFIPPVDKNDALINFERKICRHWLGFELNRIESANDMNEFKAINLALYSCDYNTYKTHNKYLFKRKIIYFEEI